MTKIYASIQIIHMCVCVRTQCDPKPKWFR